MKSFFSICALVWLSYTVAIGRPVIAGRDSIGIEEKGGKRFVLHRVNQGQTLFSIARRYGSTVTAITAANPAVSKGIRYEQVLRVPVGGGATAVAAPAKKTTPTVSQTPTLPNNGRAEESPDMVQANEGIHVVATGQTLYRLAALYHVSQDDIRRWNGLSSDNVRLGQALIVSERAYTDRQPTNAKPAETASTPAKPAPKPVTPKPEPAKPEPVKPDRTVTVPTKPAVSRPDPATSTTKPDDEPLIRPGANAPLPTTGRRVSETGLAELINDGQGSTKFLALHRTAPVGTLVLVRNDENNQSIWVKVIGRIPDTGVNDNVLIKLSSRAFAKLGTADRRFRAEVSYVLP